MLIFLIPDTLVCDEGGHVLIKAHYWTMRNIRLHSGLIAINSTKCPPNIGYSYDKIINPSKLWLKHQRNSFKRAPKCSHQFNDNLFFSWRFPKIFQSLEWDVVPRFALFVKDQASIGESRGHKFLSVIGFLCACGVFKS